MAAVRNDRKWDSFAVKAHFEGAYLASPKDVVIHSVSFVKRTIP